MKSQLPIPATSKVKTVWPFDTSGYDRRGLLTSTELCSIESFLNQKALLQGMSIRVLRKPLVRLTQPIYDALAHCALRVNDTSHATTFNLLFEEMRRTRLSYWGWSETNWGELIQRNTEAFRKRNGLTRSNARATLVALAYLIGNFTELHSIGAYHRQNLAYKVFGRRHVIETLETVMGHAQSWGYNLSGDKCRFPNLVCCVLLENRSPFIEDLTIDVLEKLHSSNVAAIIKSRIPTLSLVLKDLGIIKESISHTKYRNLESLDSRVDVPDSWLRWCDRWFTTSTLVLRTRRANVCLLHKIGRWVSKEHPEFVAPDKWTRETAASLVAAVDRLKIGDWAAHRARIDPAKIGKPLTASSKVGYLYAARIFFQDCQDWGWFRSRFNIRRSFVVPRSIRALLGPNPRNISNDVWAKLLWAGLNLTAEDLPRCGSRKLPMYPLEMVRAIVLIWLFAGLRSDEIYRLRLGCMRWQKQEGDITNADSALQGDIVCWLDVPINKTGTAFTKPVDRCVGEAIEGWQQVRPIQPPSVDKKTGEIVHLLFSYRGRKVGEVYLNNSIIPILCRKAGVPRSDARGQLTSHRARSTIASQLFNAKEPMSLWDLKEWLGHRWLSSTEHYIRTSPTRLAKAYSDAGYFGRNIRTVEVLIDKDIIMSGAAAAGQPWSFFDLGHGYCTNDYFVTCPHRMACAKCDFYIPKDSSKAQLLQGKANLLRMRQEIPLTDEEVAAVDEGITALERLCEKLADVPTPAGPTPRQLTQLTRSGSGDP